MAAALGYTVFNNFLIIIIDAYDIFGSPYLITYPYSFILIYFDNILNFGIETLLNFKNPLSLT